MIFLFASVSLFAVDEYISKIYKQLDKIFQEKSENKAVSEKYQDIYPFLFLQKLDTCISLIWHVKVIVS